MSTIAAIVECDFPGQGPGRFSKAPETSRARKCKAILVHLYLKQRSVYAWNFLWREPLNMRIKQLGNQKAWDFALAFRVRFAGNLRETDHRAHSQITLRFSLTTCIVRLCDWNLPRNELRSKGYYKRVHQNSKPTHRTENSKPDSNPLSPLCNRSAEIHHKVNSIYAKFKDVVDECEQRGQRKCCHEHRNKPKLDS